MLDNSKEWHLGTAAVGIASAVQALLTAMRDPSAIIAIVAAVAWGLAAVFIFAGLIQNKRIRGAVISLGLIVALVVPGYRYWKSGVTIEIGNTWPLMHTDAGGQIFARARVKNLDQLLPATCNLILKEITNLTLKKTYDQNDSLVLWASNADDRDHAVAQIIPPGKTQDFDFIFIGMSDMALHVPSDRFKYIFAGSLPAGEYKEILAVRGQNCDGKNMQVHFRTDGKTIELLNP